MAVTFETWKTSRHVLSL